MEKFWDRFPNFSGKSRKFSNVIPMNSPCDAEYKNMKEIHFRPFWAVFEFLGTMFQVLYYLHYWFSRPVLSCVISGPSELSIAAIKIFDLFPRYFTLYTESLLYYTTPAITTAMRPTARIAVVIASVVKHNKYFTSTNEICLAKYIIILHYSGYHNGFFDTVTVQNWTSERSSCITT